ncbi:MAG: histidine phosphatase family protein [Novosphingobium sp.]|nr:histidine phosphatase family protein [Novosphingobium sp.]
MKRLGLYRHAKSDWHDARARDFDRPLNERGRKGAAAMSWHMRDYGHQWERVIASPAVRVAETIEIGSAALGVTIPVNWDRRIYLASSATLLDLIREIEGDPASVLMVGHNPGLEDLIFDLVPDDGHNPLRQIVEDKFPTAALAVIELDIDRWADVEEGKARLVHLMRPRDLDPELGPQPVDD